jgi:hypothetical protein
MEKEIGVGIRLSPQIQISQPFPTLHISQFLSTSHAGIKLLQAKEGRLLVVAYRIVEFG